MSYDVTQIGTTSFISFKKSHIREHGAWITRLAYAWAKGRVKILLSRLNRNAYGVPISFNTGFLIFLWGVKDSNLQISNFQHLLLYLEVTNSITTVTRETLS